MAISKIKALQASIRSFKSTLGTASLTEDNHVSVQLAEYYNSLREQAAGYPELNEHLPPPIKFGSIFNEVGVTDVQSTDLLVYLNQLITLTDMLEAENET